MIDTTVAAQPQISSHVSEEWPLMGSNEESEFTGDEKQEKVNKIAMHTEVIWLAQERPSRISRPACLESPISCVSLHKWDSMTVAQSSQYRTCSSPDIQLTKFQTSSAWAFIQYDNCSTNTHQRTTLSSASGKLCSLPNSGFRRHNANPINSADKLMPVIQRSLCEC